MATPGADRGRAARRRSIVLVAFGTFMFWLALYLYVPILPLHAKDLGASLTTVGAVVASYSIAQVLLRIPIGIGADLIGRRKPFAVGAVMLGAAGALGLAVSPNPWSLFAARTVVGVGAAGWVAISVLYASYFRPERSAGAMAQIMAVNGSALVLSSLAGGQIAEAFGNESAFYAGVAAGLVGTVALLAAREPAMARRRGYSTGVFVAVLRNPLLLLVAFIGILVQFVSFGGSFGFVPVYAADLGASKSEVGYITTAMFAASVVGILASPLGVRLAGYRMSLLVSSAIVAFAVFVVPAVHSVGLLIGDQALVGLGRGAANTLLISLTVRAARPAERATAMGIYQAIYAIGMLSGPVVAGVAADSFGIDSVFYLLGAVAALGGVLALAPAIPRT